MSESWRQYEAKFKPEAALELLKGERTPAQICRERGISQDLLPRWKDTFRERAADIFSDGGVGMSEKAVSVTALDWFTRSSCDGS